MASTKADNNRVAWTYTTHDGEDFRVSAKAVYVLDGTDGAKYGGSAASANLRPLPTSFRMRQVKCTDAAGATRAVVAYEETATIWTTAGTQLTLNKNGVDTTFETSSDLIPERYGRQTKQQS